MASSVKDNSVLGILKIRFLSVFGIRSILAMALSLLLFCIWDVEIFTLPIQTQEDVKWQQLKLT